MPPMLKPSCVQCQDPEPSVERAQQTRAPGRSLRHAVDVDSDFDLSYLMVRQSAATLRHVLKANDCDAEERALDSRMYECALIVCQDCSMTANRYAELCTKHFVIFCNVVDAVQMLLQIQLISDLALEESLEPVECAEGNGMEIYLECIIRATLLNSIYSRMTAGPIDCSLPRPADQDLCSAMHALSKTNMTYERLARYISESETFIRWTSLFMFSYDD